MTDQLPLPRREALLLLDSKLKVCAANKCFYELFRLAPDECIGQKVYEVGGRAWDKKLRAMLEAVLDGGSKSDHFELIHDASAPGHGVLWLSAKIVPSASPGDQTILLSIEDLNAVRTVEESLVIAMGDLKAVADLAGSAAHELNNLLTVVRMNAELLEPELASQGLSVQEVKDIIGAAERAEAVTRRLLVSSRRVRPQATGLDSVVGADVAEVKPGARERKRAGVSGLMPPRHRETTGTETILLVEDEKTLRKLQKRILTTAGYRVLEASDGVKALRLAAGEVGEIDLVLTDVEMPTLGGRGMVDELHELSPSIRILFMSGYTDSEILRRGIDTAETQFLRKPFTADVLIAAVRSALNRPTIATA